MDPIDVDGIEGLDGSRVLRHLEPVLETVRRLRSDLPTEPRSSASVALPDRCDHMIAGSWYPDQAPARLFAYRHPKAFKVADVAGGCFG